MRCPTRQFLGRSVDRLLLCTLVAGCAVFIVWPIGSFVWQALVPAQGAPGLLASLADNATAIANSAFAGVLTSLLSCAIALCVALVVVFGPRRWASVVNAFATVSMISPPFVASLAYIELFGRRGLVTHGILGLSVNPYGWQGVVLMQALFFAAVNVMILRSALERVDKSVVQAALDVGAPMRRVFADVVAPLLRPALAVCLLLTFVRSVSDYGTPIVIGGKFETIATQIYLRVVGYSDLSSAAALNLAVFAVAVAAFVAYRAWGNPADVASQTLAGSVRPAAGEAGFRLTGALGAVVHLACAAFVAFLAVLYAAIVHAAFTKGMGWGAAFTWDNLEHLVEFDLASLGRSILYSLLSALVATALGLLSAYFAQRRKVAGCGVLDFLTTLPYAVPGMCLGLGYILAFNAPPLELVGTGAVIVAVLASKELAISTRAFTAALAQVPPELDMAARDLGATRPEVLFGVLLPNLRGAVGVSLVNGFSSSMVAYAAVLFLIAPGHKTAIFELFDALSGGKYGEAAMISLALMAVTALVNAVFHKVLIERRPRRVSRAQRAV